MADGYNFQKLKKEILALSNAHDWDTAKAEWQLVDVYDSEEQEECLCGHFPIREICTIKNRLNQNETEVGNVCVKKFLGLNSGAIFIAIKKIRDDESSAMGADAVVFFYEKNVLTDWEYEFYSNTRLKRNLSERQFDIREAINRKILAAVKKRGFKGPD